MSESAHGGKRDGAGRKHSVKTKQVRVQIFAEPKMLRELLKIYVEKAISSQREIHQSWKNAELEVVSVTLEKRELCTSGMFGIGVGSRFEEDVVVVKLIDTTYKEEIEKIFTIGDAI